MKRLVSFLMVVCLLLSCVSVALAAKPSITKQPETQTVKAGGKLTFKVKAKNAAGQSITWYFTNPETGESTTGKKLSSVVPGVKVKNANSLNITLSKIPEEMHGWTLYCHIGAKSSGVNSDAAMILIAGKEVPAMPVKVQASSSSDSEGGETGTAASVETAAAPVVEPAGPIVITGSKIDLYELDRKGKVVGTAKSELTFENGDANFYVKLPEGTEGSIQYITVDSLRITPEGENVTGMSVRGWKSSATVKVKISKPSDGTEEEIQPRAAKEEEPVDEADLVSITCTNCRFTGWHNSFAESGRVPVGSTITVIASGGMISKGYSINGAKAEYKNQASFQLVVEGDTEITMQKQK